MSEESIVVFTGESIDTILGQGGTSAWHLARNRARRCPFAVCARNANSRADCVKVQRSWGSHSV